MKQTVLEARHLSILQDGEYLMRDVHFSAYEGELVSFCQVGFSNLPLMELICWLPGTYTLTGELYYLGKRVDRHSPVNAFCIPQSNILIPSLSIADNLLAIRPNRRRRFLYHSAAADAFLVDFLTNQQLPFDFRTPIDQLRDPQKRMLLLLKAVLMDARVILMDGITEHCNPQDMDWMLRFIAKYKQAGKTFIHISNNNNFLVENSDRSYVLRNRSIADVVFKDDYQKHTFEMMLYGYQAAPCARRELTADVRQLVLEMDLSGLFAERFALQAHAGEVVGLLDQYGSFEDQIFRNFWEGLPYKVNGCHCASYKEAVQNGLAVIPRQLDKAIFEGFSTAENLTFQKLPSISSASFIHSRMEKYCVKQYLSKISAFEDRPDTYLGKMQLLAYRWLLVSSKVMVIQNPMLAMEDDLHSAFASLVQDITQAGCALILLSSAPNDCIGLCDKAYIIHQFNEVSFARQSESLRANGL